MSPGEEPAGWNREIAGGGGTVGALLKPQCGPGLALAAGVLKVSFSLREPLAKVLHMIGF